MHLKCSQHKSKRVWWRRSHSCVSSAFISYQWNKPGVSVELSVQLLCLWKLLLLLFPCLLLCSLLILHFGKWTNTACRTEVVELPWPAWTKKQTTKQNKTMGVWMSRFHSCHFSEGNALGRVATLSLALWSQQSLSSIPISSLVPLSLTHAEFEPMKEFDETRL